MHPYTVLTIVAVVACGLSACAAPQSRNQSNIFDACIAGKECTAEGTLSLHAGQPPAWVALLEAGDACAKLALPDDFYSDRQAWDGKKITVSGRAFEQPGFDESQGIVTLWYTELDRKLALGMCDHGIGIYVESMRSSTGKEWPVPAK